MKEYKIEALEQEQWRRVYFIKAENKEEAVDKVINGDNEGNEDGDMFNFEVSIDNIEEF